jgi:hypothetical protein
MKRNLTILSLLFATIGTLHCMEGSPDVNGGLLDDLTLRKMEEDDIDIDVWIEGKITEFQKSKSSTPAAWKPQSLITKAILDGEIELVESTQLHKSLKSPSRVWQEEGYWLRFTNKQGRTFRGDFMNLAAYNFSFEKDHKDTPETQEAIDAFECFMEDVYEDCPSEELESLAWIKERGFWGAVIFFNELKTHKEDIIARLEEKAKQESAKATDAPLEKE